MFMIENVEGLKNINKGQTLNYIVKKMTKLGYNVVYKVLNSVNYDVPQKRKRLIIIGTKYDVKFIYPKTNKKIITIKDAYHKKLKLSNICLIHKYIHIPVRHNTLDKLKKK